MIQEIPSERTQNENYGAPRMQQALNQRDVKAGLRQVKRIMRKHGWLHQRSHGPKGLTQADPAAKASENLLKQVSHADMPFTKLLTDITKVQCWDGKLYISPIMDCYSGENLLLEMRDNMKRECASTSSRPCQTGIREGCHTVSDMFRLRMPNRLLCSGMIPTLILRNN